MFARSVPLLKTKRGFIGACLLFYGAVRGILSLLQDVTYAATNWGAIVDFLASGLGNIVVIVAGILLILWAVFTQHPEIEPASEAAPKPEANRQREQLEYQNQQLRQQLEKATSEAGLPADAATRREIKNCDFRIIDLLKLTGSDGSYILSKEFENCTIRGPGIITREGKPPGNRGTFGTVSHIPTLYVEGNPDSVLYEVRPNAIAASGVIHLVGCSYKRVTFSGVGIAGSPEEVAWWREHATFSEPAPDDD